MKVGALYLIPNFIGRSDPSIIPDETRSIIKSINIFIVENGKTARRFIKAAGKPLSDDIEYHELNKHQLIDDPGDILEEILNGHNVGLLSDAGSPAIADPGASIVEMAHEMKIKVVPLAGPSSIYMALMASGLNGQRFSFVGYLPRERDKRINRIQELEKRSLKNDETIIIMEAPHRNQHLADDMIANCRPNTLLCIARNINGEHELITTLQVKSWKENKPELPNEPTLFLLLAQH